MKKMLHPSSFILHPSRRAFTLIELLIVIVILGILATIVVPQFSNASINAKENTLKDELRYLRTQIVVYKAQHHDVPPGYPNGDRTVPATGQRWEESLRVQGTEGNCGRCSIDGVRSD